MECNETTKGKRKISILIKLIYVSLHTVIIASHFNAVNIYFKLSVLPFLFSPTILFLSHKSFPVCINRYMIPLKLTHHDGWEIYSD